uniref:Uncharacterized protein n=1 Tax=Physcomitrium patens TaxID=3218 RepID=A0A2K1J8S9_PHYPA|nr:hypothetical protein PHYPA_021029 [Physcomitrium patens]
MSEGVRDCWSWRIHSIESPPINFCKQKRPANKSNQQLGISNSQSGIFAGERGCSFDAESLFFLSSTCTLDTNGTA